MEMSRRDFVRTAGIAATVLPAASRTRTQASAAPLPVRVGMTDWNLGKRGDITKIALAREIGLDGIQVSLTFPTDGSPHCGSRRRRRRSSGPRSTTVCRSARWRSAHPASRDCRSIPTRPRPSCSSRPSRSHAARHHQHPPAHPRRQPHRHDQPGRGRHLRRDDEGGGALRREGGCRRRARGLDLGRGQPQAARCDRVGLRRGLLRRAQHQGEGARSVQASRHCSARASIRSTSRTDRADA